MLVIHHSADMDGIACAAIMVRARKQLPNMILHGMDYKDPIPWGLINKETLVWMLDFSFPLNDMLRLNKSHILTWVDHHEPIMKAVEASGQEIPGLRRVGTAACCLLWEYLNPQDVKDPPTLPPRPLWLLGEYDVGRFDVDRDVMPAQFGARVLLDDPKDPLWDKALFTGPLETTMTLVDAGETVLRYEKQQAAKLVADSAFEVQLNGYPVLACNNWKASNLMFESRFNPTRHAFVLSFQCLSDKRWKISMRAPKDSQIHLGELAKKYGGSGHAGAAGMVVDVLPFEL